MVSFLAAAMVMAGAQGAVVESTGELSAPPLVDAPVAASAPAPMSSPPLVEAHVDAPVAPRKHAPMFGVSLDAGLPDGVTASFNFRPWRFLRLSVGGGTNAVSAGLRGGLTFVPINFVVSPSLTVEGGHYFPGDANNLAKSFGSTSSSAFLEGFGYDYLNAHLGVEIGRGEPFMFFIHAGYSRMWLDVNGVSSALNSSGQSGFTADTAHVQINTLSAKLGFALFFG